MLTILMETQIVVKPPFSRIMKSGRVLLMPDEDVGEHTSDKREELIIILNGDAAIIADGETIQISEGETYFIKEGVKHNVKNISDEPLEYIYVVSTLD